jgi:IclR family transcriptional regulator, KDG regulon repressor
MKAVKSIVKASRVLELFSSNDKSLTLGEIAQSLNMDDTTANRIVSTLVTQGLLKQQKKRGKYSLGVRFLDLGVNISGENKNGFGVIPYLIELSKLVNETIHLSFWGGSNILFSRAPDYYSESCKKPPTDWKSTPLHSTAVGKLILSGMSDEDLKKYFRSTPLEKHTDYTLTDIDLLKDQLLSVKRECIAFEMGESDPGINSVAAGIKDHDGEIVGAVVVTGYSKHLTHELLNKIMPTVKICAVKISRELGYRDQA